MLLEFELQCPGKNLEQIIKSETQKKEDKQRNNIFHALAESS